MSESTIIIMLFFFSITIIALVAITYRQKDIAALALRLLSRSMDQEPADEPEYPVQK